MLFIVSYSFDQNSLTKRNIGVQSAAGTAGQTACAAADALLQDCWIIP
jgi:hypothetical protein